MRRRRPGWEPTRDEDQLALSDAARERGGFYGHIALTPAAIGSVCAANKQKNTLESVARPLNSPLHAASASRPAICGNHIEGMP